MQHGRVDGLAVIDARPVTPVCILHRLFNDRSRFTDVEIHCSDGHKVYAHKAILAVRERFFQERFFPAKNVAATDRYGQRGRQRSASMAIFREESSMLLPILEFLYTGLIRALHDAPRSLSDAEGRHWLRFLTWCARNDITSVSSYVHDVIIGHVITTTCAAEVLAVLAASDIALSDAATSPSAADAVSPSWELRMRQNAELKALAVAAFRAAPFDDALFLPLTREALKLLLCSTQFDAPAADVCRAVARWANESTWVRSNVMDGRLSAEHLVDVTCLLNPTEVPAPDFVQIKDLFTKSIQTEVFKALATRRPSRVLSDLSRRVSRGSEVHLSDLTELQELSRSRLLDSLSRLQLQAESASTVHRSFGRNSNVGDSDMRRDDALSNGLVHSALPPALQDVRPYDQVHPASAGARPSASAPPCDHFPGDDRASSSSAPDQLLATPPPPAASAARPAPPEAPDADEAARPRQLPPGRSLKRMLTRVESMTGQGTTGNLPPTMPPVDPQAARDPRQLLHVRSMAARSDPLDPKTAFQYGVRLVLHPESDFSTLVSSDTMDHQSVIYKVGLTSGTLRWSITVVRPCDMLWMGVTAEFDIDVSQWAARFNSVWMASEESSCLAVIADYTRLKRDEPYKRHDMHAAHIGLTRYPCVRCLTLPDEESNDHWSHVVAELRADSGELWMDVNNTGMQLAFHSLPRGVPLYPVVSVINAAQIRFEHLQ